MEWFANRGGKVDRCEAAQGNSAKIMDGQFEREISNLFVAKRRNSPAITYVLRLDIANFSSQPDSPRLMQSFLNSSKALRTSDSGFHAFPGKSRLIAQ